MNAVPYFHTYYMWLIIAVCLAAFVTAIVRLGNFRKDQKLADTYAKLLYDYNMALEEQGNIAKEYGHNSPELLAAKDRSMGIWKQMESVGIQ